MADRDLILGVLATQAGFVTPAQVVAAAAARMVAGNRGSVLDQLVSAGALTPAQREVVVALADAITAASGGSTAQHLEARRDGARDLSGTLAATVSDGPEKGPAAVLVDDAGTVAMEREGQYVRLSELGRGGQSIVWRARDRYMRREVALKELAPSQEEKLAETASAARSRFLREAWLTAELDHPGIVAIHDLGERPDGTLYCAQKLIRGRTLKAALAECRTLPQRLELLPHLVNAAQAVAYAHAQGVVHRDLKPSNVMLGEYGETVVVDWGLAKRRGEPDPLADLRLPDAAPGLTRAGEAVGTPAYMSPEQARGDLAAIDERSDVFGFGVMLYEMLTGSLPFEGVDKTQIMDAVLAGRFAPVRVRCPQAPPELAAIAERALQSVPGQRYPAAAAMAQDLVAYRAGRRVEAYSYGTLELVRKFVVRNPALSAAIGAALLVLAVSAAVVLVQLRKARVNLAAALVERARRAEDASDWARAAAYYAASRLENDTLAARWGVALARERLPERTGVLHGWPGAFMDVDVRKDGTVLALERRGHGARLYEAVTDRTLWSSSMNGEITGAELSDGAVLLRSGPWWRVLDEMTGRERFTYDADRGFPCRRGFASRRAWIERPGVLHLESAPELRLEVGIRPACAISPEGDRLAIRDQTGLIRLWDVETGKEIASRPAPDAEDLIFTAHGVAAVRSASLQLFGGPDGDFSVEVPGRVGSGFTATPGGRGISVSPDGHRVVVDSPTLDRADVVDLRDRTVFVSVARPPGDPSYAFSPDGSTLYAAGLAGGGLLVSWNLRRPAVTASGSRRTRVYLRAGGRRFVIFEYHRGAEVRSEDGSLVREVPDEEAEDVTISADDARLAISRSHEILVENTDDGRVLAHVPCELCRVVRISSDGSRLLGLSSGFRKIWDLRGPSVLREEPLGGLRMGSGVTLTPAGDRFAWIEPERVVMEEVQSGARKELSLPEIPTWQSVSPEGGRIAITAPGLFGVWRVPGLEPMWITPNPSSAGAAVGWSTDGSTLIVAYDGAGAALLDARTGELLARIVEGRSGAIASQVNVLPSLRYRVLRGPNSWALSPLPAPDTSSPAESLRRALAEGGFRLRGVDLEAVVP